MDITLPPKFTQAQDLNEFLIAYEIIYNYIEYL